MQDPGFVFQPASGKGAWPRRARRPAAGRAALRHHGAEYGPGLCLPYRGAAEAARRQAPLDTLTNRITSGKSDGWSLIYANEPEGEQLEFVQVRGQAKRVFGEAIEARAAAATRG